MVTEALGIWGDYLRDGSGLSNLLNDCESSGVENGLLKDQVLNYIEGLSSPYSKHYLGMSARFHLESMGIECPSDLPRMFEYLDD